MNNSVQIDRKSLNVVSSYPIVEWCCDFCAQKFSSNNTLKTHVNKEHSVSASKMTNKKEVQQKYSCQQCDFTTPSSVVLRNHELVHTYTKTCPHCPKKFFQDSHLKFHLATHGDHKSGVLPRIVTKANIHKILKHKTEPVSERGEIIVKKEEKIPKRKKIKLEEEFLIESDTEVTELLMNSAAKIEVLNEEYETELQESSQDEMEPVIQSVCCDLEFQDLLSLLTHVHETHAKTFSTTMNAMQPIVEEAFQNKRVSFKNF